MKYQSQVYQKLRVNILFFLIKIQKTFVFQLPPSNFTTILSMLDIDNPTVACFLIDQVCLNIILH